MPPPNCAAAPETNGLGFGGVPVPLAAPFGAPVPLGNGTIVVVPIIEVLAYGAVPGAELESGAAEGEDTEVRVSEEVTGKVDVSVMVVEARVEMIVVVEVEVRVDVIVVVGVAVAKRARREVRRRVVRCIVRSDVVGSVMG